MHDALLGRKRRERNRLSATGAWAEPLPMIREACASTAPIANHLIATVRAANRTELRPADQDETAAA
jgi:hypothetical protein